MTSEGPIWNSYNSWEAKPAWKRGGGGEKPKPNVAEIQIQISFLWVFGGSAPHFVAYPQLLKALSWGGLFCRVDGGIFQQWASRRHENGLQGSPVALRLPVALCWSR